MGQFCNKYKNMEALEHDNIAEGEEEVEEDGEDELEEEESEEEEEEEEEALPELRSLNCDTDCSVVFRSTTKREVDLFWVNYKGERVKYATLKPGKKYSVRTFETHPWIFRDSSTGAIIHGNGEEVFMPYSKVFNDEDSDDEEDDFTVTVQVGIPVYRLLQRCVEVCGQVYNDLKVQDMELPVCLKMELLTHQMNRNIPCSLYDRYDED